VKKSSIAGLLNVQERGLRPQTCSQSPEAAAGESRTGQGAMACSCSKEFAN